MNEINNIINEAIKTYSISYITTEQRMIIGNESEKITGQKVDIFCNSCLIKACFNIHENNINKLNIKSNEKSKSETKRGARNPKRN